MFYKGYTDIYIPFPDIAKETPESMHISPKKFSILYAKEMDNWLKTEMGAEHAYDDRTPAIIGA